MAPKSATLTPALDARPPGPASVARRSAYRGNLVEKARRPWEDVTSCTAKRFVEGVNIVEHRVENVRCTGNKYLVHTSYVHWQGVNSELATLPSVFERSVLLVVRSYSYHCHVVLVLCTVRYSSLLFFCTISVCGTEYCTAESLLPVRLRGITG